MLLRINLLLLVTIFQLSVSKAQVIGADLFVNEVNKDSVAFRANAYFFCNSYFKLDDTLRLRIKISPTDTINIKIVQDSSTYDTVYTNCEYCGCPDTFCNFPFIVRKSFFYDLKPSDFGFQNACEIWAKFSPAKRFGGNTYLPNADTTVLNLEAYSNLCNVSQKRVYSFEQTPQFYTIKDQLYIHSQGFVQHFDTLQIDLIDSLSISLSPPINSLGKEVIYKKGFDAKNPLQYNGYPNTSNSFPRGFHLNQTSGDIRFIANQEGDAIIKSRFNVFNQKKEKIAFGEREFLVFILKNKSERVPYLTGKNNSNFLVSSNYVLENCFNQKGQFRFTANDLNKDGISQIEINIPEAFKNYVQSTIINDTLIINCDFDSLLISNRPLRVVVNVFDTLCKSGSQTSYTLLLYNNYKPITKPIFNYIGNRKFQLSGKDSNGFEAQSYLWRINGKTYSRLDTSFLLKLPGDYKFSLKSFGKGGCISILDSFYKTPNFPYLVINKVSGSICQFDSTNLKARYFNSAQPPDFYWNGQNLNSSFDIILKSDTLVIVEGRFNDGTTNSDTLALRPFLNPIPIIIGGEQQCKGNTATLIASYNPLLIDSANGIKWSFDGITISNKDTIKVTGEPNVTLQTTYNNGCVNRSSKQLVNTKSYNIGKYNKVSCPLQELKIQVNTSQGFIHNWYLNDSLVLKDSSNYHIKRANRKDTIVLITTFKDTNYNCLFEDTIKIDILPIQEFQILGDTSFCANDPDLSLFDSTFINVKTGKWSEPKQAKSALVNDSFFVPSRLAPIAKKHILTYTTVHSQSGCPHSRDIHFNVLPIFPPQFVVDSIKLCIGGNNVLLNNANYAIPSNGFWEGPGVFKDAEENRQYFSPSLVGINSTNEIIYRYKGSNGCTSLSPVTVTVNLKPNPIASVKSGVTPISIVFEDKRDDSDCTVDEWFWDFYDIYGKRCTSTVASLDSLDIRSRYCRYSTAPKPVHRYSKSGIYPVKLIVRDSKTGIKDSIFKNNYIYLIGDGNSIDEKTTAVYSIYPNPASNFIFIEQNGNNQLFYSLTSTTGQQVKKGTFSSQQKSIPLYGLKGLYLISVFDAQNNLIFTESVLVK